MIFSLGPKASNNSLNSQYLGRGFATPQGKIYKVNFIIIDKNVYYIIGL